MIEQIDFRKLLPYDGSAWQSFEMLCYVIAKRLYPNGEFTPINGKGGDGGIEFYQTLPNGKIIIWQCKYFDRLGNSQKNQIKDSYNTAVKNHGARIEKWIICSPIDFTPAGDEWFKDFCKGKLPIEAWGESELVNYLAHMPDVCNFFFNAKYLTQKWFDDHASLMLSNGLVTNKYISELHHQTEAQREIHSLLDSCSFEERIEQIKELYWWNYYINGLSWEEKSLKENFDKADKINSLMNCALSQCKGVEETLQQIADSFKKLLWNGIMSGINSLRNHHKYLKSTLKQLQEFKTPIVKSKCFHISKILEVIETFIASVENLLVSVLHIIGDASSGKSHIAIDTFAKYETADGRNPSILILAKALNSSLSAEEAILDILGLSKEYCFDDLLSSLDVASEVSGHRALMVIDGLNELYGSLTMWKRDLPLLLSKLSRHPNILLILTYRQSYTEALGLSNLLNNPATRHSTIEVGGFDRVDVEDIMAAYFRHFGITIKGRIPERIYQLFSERPILIRLFCEANKGNACIEMDKLSLIGIFEQYLSYINKKLIDELGKNTRFDGKFLFGKLDLIAKFLWDNSTQFIPIEEFAKHGTDKELEAIDGEDLLVIREYTDGREAMSFTFDILGGYLIAKSLLSGISSKDRLYELIKSDKFQKELIIQSDIQHPLKDVILDDFIRLSLLKFGFCFDKNLPIPYGWIVPILFEMPNETLTNQGDRIRDYVKEVFMSSSGMLNNISTVNLDDERHPLSANSLTRILLDMPMNLRDLTLAEGLRNNRTLKSYIKSGKAKGLTALSLSTTDLVLRRTLAEKLYKLAIDNPSDFIKNILPITDCDDEYVQEGILGALYGACLMTQDFDDYLTIPAAEAIASMLINHSWINVGHYLVRNYLRLIMRLAERKGFCIPDSVSALLKQHDNTEVKKEIDSWSLAEHEVWPMYHDFSNYTLGGIIHDGGAYNNPPLKQRGRWYILEQIKKQGWDATLFDPVDRQIERSNYSPRGDDMDGKVERYGKKYSWIGYYRLAKILEDANMLDTEWYKWRIPEVQYDPTFPFFGVNERLITQPLLEDLKTMNDEWIKTPFDVRLVKDLLKREMEGEDYICLWGQYSEKNEEVRRKHLVFIKGIMVDKENTNDFAQCISSSCDNFHIRDCCDVLNTFGAEFDCWSECTPSNEQDVCIRIEEMSIKTKITEENWHEYLGEHNIGDEIEERGYKCKDYHILNPVVKYLCELNGQNGDYFYLAKEIKKDLCLKHNPNTNNLLDRDSKEAIKIYQYLPNELDGSFTFFFIREDLIQEWLTAKGKGLVWLLWGEKETWDEDSSDLRPMHHYESFNKGVVFNRQ